MTPEIAILFVILLVMAFFFFTEKLPVDLTAFCGLVLLVFLGFVKADEAFTGFSSPAVITMLSVFIVSGGMLHTGIADFVGARVHALIGSREVALIVAIMLVSGVLSAFMNNIAAAAVLLPAVAAISHNTGISPSKLFMPLSFGAILGGTTTLVGTPPNILAADMLSERGLEPFNLFDFTPLGLILLMLGIVYMVFIGRKQNPDRQISTAVSSRGDLQNIYQLQQNMFSFKVTPDSRLAGKTLAEAEINKRLGIQVVSILRASKNKQRLAPRANTLLNVDDVLIVKGVLSNLEQLFDSPGTRAGKAKRDHFEVAAQSVTLRNLKIEAHSQLVGSTIAESRFRDRFRASVIAVRRQQSLIDDHFVDLKLQQGDELVVVVGRNRLLALHERPHVSLVPLTSEQMLEIRRRIVWIRVSAQSPLFGKSVYESCNEELQGLFVAGIIRDGEPMMMVTRDETFAADDQVFLVGHMKTVNGLRALSDVEIVKHEGAQDIESQDVGVVEITLSPRSGAAGSSLKELNFRDKYGLQVLSVWREGNPVHDALGSLRLQFGDALLVQGKWERIRILGTERDYVVLSPIAQQERRYKKAPYALLALAFMIVCVITGFQPIHVAAFAAATLVVLSGAISMEEAYRNVEWRAVFLVASILPVGIAMERTGASDTLANLVLNSLGPYGPYAVLAGLIFLSSLLSQCLDGAPAVVLLTPMALQITDQLGISPYPIMMGVSLAASAAFMTPFSHKANLLVMGAGGYRVIDYVRVGTPLTVVVLTVLVILVPVFFPF